MEFDLSPESDSMRIFNAYISEKREKGKMESAWPTTSGHSGVDEPDLSPEDETAIEAMWNDNQGA